MSLLSVVVPCYNEQEVLYQFFMEIRRVAALLEEKFGCGIELFFVDDGSSDDTLSIIKKFREEDKRVHFISFSRNFGKEAGMLAGLESATGDYCVVMDADLQDPPDLLVTMYEMISDGDCDCVCTRRSNRKGEPFFRSLFARMFYRLMKKISSVNMVEGVRDYRFMSRKVVDSILKLREYNRFSKGLFSWVGYKTKFIEFENVERAAGKTKWSFWNLLQYSVEGIIAFSTVPLLLSIVVGLLFGGTACAGFIFALCRTLLFSNPVSDMTLLVFVAFLFSGILLFCFGIMSLYLSKVYMEAKDRPIFIIRERE